MDIERNFVALSIVVVLAPLSVACSGGPDLQPETVGSAEQAVVTPGLGFQAAFQGNGSTLWLSGDPTKDTGGAMIGTTSPSIAGLDGGGFEAAFQSSSGTLWLTGKTGMSGINTNQAMTATTSPSITALDYPGGYEVAYQERSNNHFLCVYGTERIANLGYGMKAGTNPTVAALPGGGWVAAFQANTGKLWVVGTGGLVIPEIAAMAPNTSPSIASRPGGAWQVAYQGANYDLWTFDGNPPVDRKRGMANNATSPSIAAVPSGGYEMAFRANTGYLWVTGDLGETSTIYGIAANTSPSIAVSDDGRYVVAFTANQSNHLWFYNSAGGQDTGGAMKPGSSPGIGPIDALMQYSNDNTCSSITPMGLHFESLAQQNVSQSTLAYLSGPTQLPDTPPDMSSSTWHAFPVTLYPSGTPVVSDVNQHDIGDCGGMAVLADLAYLAPAFIKSIITNNHDGTFSVAVYDPKGISRTVKIDSRFLSDSSNKLQAAGTKKRTANWVTVLEKVAMKYLHAFPVRGQIGGIDPQDMAPIFTGTGCSYNFDRTLPSSADFRRVVEASLRHGKLLVGGFSGDNKSGTNYGKNPGHVGNIGIFAGHYYSSFWPTDSSMMATLRNPYGVNPPYPSGPDDGSRDGLIDFPLNQTDPSIPYTWEKYMGLRVVYPGVARTAGRSTPYVYSP